MNYQVGDSVTVVRRWSFLPFWPFRRFGMPRPRFSYGRAKGSGTIVEVIEPSQERGVTNAGGYKVVLTSCGPLPRRTGSGNSCRFSTGSGLASPLRPSRSVDSDGPTRRLFEEPAARCSTQLSAAVPGVERQPCLSELPEVVNLGH